MVAASPGPAAQMRDVRPHEIAGGTIAVNRLHYGAVAAGAIALTLPGSPRQEPTNPAAAVAQSPLLVRAEELRWEDCSAALPRGPKCATLEGDRTLANQPFTYRLKIPDGYHIPPHVHPVDGHLTVISGTLNIGWGDKFDVKATKPMAAGSFIVIPRGARHFYWTQRESTLQSYGTGPRGATCGSSPESTRKG